jgi:hypothetical protein
VKTRIYEGIREEVPGVSQITINFKEVHNTLPCVNVSVEPGASNEDDHVVASIESISTSKATVSFSNKFYGYLHLHVFSS